MKIQKDTKQRRLPRAEEFINPGVPNPLFEAAASNLAASLAGLVRLSAFSQGAPAPAFERATIPRDAQFEFFTPQTLRVPFALGYQPYGFYLMTGETGVGKSTVAVALYLWCWATGTASRYIPLGEPRSPDPEIIRSADLGNMETWLKSGSFYRYSDPERWPSGLLFLDSVGLAMRMYGPDKRGKLGAMKEGMSPMDQEFVRQMQLAARERGPTFGIVNANEVPFAEELLGLCEGVLTVISPTAFSIVSRSGTRTPTTITIPEPYVRAARIALGYSDQSPAASDQSASSTLIVR